MPYPATPQLAWRPGVITERSGAMVVLLGIITCGIYHFIWLHKTSDELREATSDTGINPGVDLILVLITCGLWGLFLLYRNVQKVQAAQRARGLQRPDQSQTVMVLAIATFFVGVTGLVATYLVQEELNALAKAP